MWRFIFSSNLLDASSTASLRKAGSFVRVNERILRSVAIDGELLQQERWTEFLALLPRVQR